MKSGSEIQCSSMELLTIARISWLSCQQYLQIFQEGNSDYTLPYVEHCEEEIIMAEVCLRRKQISGKNSDEIEYLLDVIKGRLLKLYRDAEQVFKHHEELRRQFSWNEIYSLVKAIP